MINDRENKIYHYYSYCRKSAFQAKTKPVEAHNFEERNTVNYKEDEEHIPQV